MHIRNSLGLRPRKYTAYPVRSNYGVASSMAPGWISRFNYIFRVNISRNRSTASATCVA